MSENERGLLEENEKVIYEIFKRLGIDDYSLVNHQPIHSVEDAIESGFRMPGLSFKNLLIRDKKKDKYYLLILDDSRKMDSKHFKALTGWGKIRFASEDELWEKMKLIPGSVSPYGLINDKDHSIVVILERSITGAADDELINFHPNRNTGTITVRKRQFIKYLEYLGNELIYEPAEAKDQSEKN